MDRENMIRLLREVVECESIVQQDRVDAIQAAIETFGRYDRVLRMAKAMHTWIFLNTFDEQAVYDKLGFTDEDNALLGSIGRPMVIKVGDVKGNDAGRDH